jgi:hypothetical protein
MALIFICYSEHNVFGLFKHVLFDFLYYHFKYTNYFKLNEIQISFNNFRYTDGSVATPPFFCAGEPNNWPCGAGCYNFDDWNGNGIRDWWETEWWDYTVYEPGIFFDNNCFRDAPNTWAALPYVCQHGFQFYLGNFWLTKTNICL